MYMITQLFDLCYPAPRLEQLRTS